MNGKELVKINDNLKQDGELTIEKLLKAKKIMDAEQVPGRGGILHIPIQPHETYMGFKYYAL